jgi:hypothetical protein
MKTRNAIYWISTGLFALWMLANAKAYLTSEEAKMLCLHFGFPGYFRVELAVAKVLGTIILLLPFKGNIKEWAYAGFSITVISGFIAHLASADSMASSASAMVALGILLISYFTYHHLKQIKK